MRTGLFDAQPIDDVVLTNSRRIKIHIYCRKCGETYILRAPKNAKGHVETGFKRCLCNNESDFDVQRFV